MTAPATPPPTRTLRLTTAGARALAVAAQALERRPRRRARKADVLACIRRMGALQIDTIHVVARSPYLVLWSRLGDYRPEWLDQLLKERKIFEYWAHEACFLPIEDYPLFRWRMLEPESQGWHYRAEFMRKHRAETAAVREHLQASGPLRSADFEHAEGMKGGGWWGWKTEKRILEYLFTAGEVMIAGRERFQRLYDLRERVLPPALRQGPAPIKEDAVRQLALLATRALGVARAGWVADYFRTDKRSTPHVVRALAAEGALITVQVDGWKEPGYVHPDNGALLEQAVDGALRTSRTTLLSPFDPLVWDRKRARELFGFDYALECYIPGPKRRWGYYVLPILRGNALVGRLDAKAHRRKDGASGASGASGGGTFEVKSLWLEEGVRITDRLASDIASALVACAAWHGTPEVAVRRVQPDRFGDVLARALANTASPPDVGAPIAQPGDVARPDGGGAPAAAD